MAELKLPMSISNNQAKEAAAHFSYQVLSSGQEAENILMAAKQFTHSVLLQTFAAVFYLFAQTNSTDLKAKEHLKQAEKHLSESTVREKMWYQAIRAWSEFNYEQAITILMAIARQWPKDLLAVKLTEWLNYCSGQVVTAKRMLTFCQEIAKENRSNSHFLAINAFAYELDNQLEEAYCLASEAVNIEYNTPWAHHALAHYFLRSGQIKKGTEVLEGFKASWKNILKLLSEHNHWHLALHYLAQRDEQKTINYFNNNIWNNYPDIVLEQIDAISLLWRMDMAGMAYDTTIWQDIVGYIHQYADDHYLPFNNLHHFYALVKAGDEQTALAASAKLKAYSIENNAHPRWREVALPALNGVIAFAKKDYIAASEFFKPVIDDIFIGGGSDAQNELFTQTAMIAAIKAGDIKTSKRIFNTYLSHYDKTMLAAYWSSLL